MKKLLIPIVVAFVLWFVMFSPQTAGLLNFWYAMSCSAIVLILMSIGVDKKEIKEAIRFSWKDVGIGVGSAVVLWGVFWLGNFCATKMFDFASGQIGNVYAMKEGNNLSVIAFLLLFLIGPAEEIFWHGFVQRNISKKYGFLFTVGLTSLIYSVVHIPSLNFMLIMAALVCGVFWSILYYYNKNLLTLIISHAMWDCAIFVVFPIS